MQIRDRIKELRRVPAADLIPNARNWRTHPQSQQDALRGVLAEVGYADAVLVRELCDGRLELIDGHLRAETTPGAKIPALVLDVDEQEANKISLTHDPLAMLATTDQEQVRSLIQACQVQHPQVREMLDQLDRDIDRASEQLEDPANRPEVQIPESFQVVVECRDEAQQQDIYQRMKKEGYPCRVLTL